MSLKRKRNNGIKASSRKRRGSIPAGPFDMNWSEHPDGPIPASMGLTDVHDVIPMREDRMGIVDGKLALMEKQGIGDQNFTHSGWRGAVYRDTKTLSNNVYGTGVALIHINNASKHWGIAAWYNSYLQYMELGVIGRDQPDFAYLDVTWHPPVDDWSNSRIRSVDGYVSIEVNDEIWCGPVAIPPDLLGSTKHGAQMDIGDASQEGVGLGVDSSIGFDDTPIIDTRSTPSIRSKGTAVNTASSTTINIPYPPSIQAGDILLIILATKNGGSISATDFTDPGIGVSVILGIGIRSLQKTATGTETGSITVTKSNAGVMAGIMLAIPNNLSISRQYDATTAANSSASTSISTPAARLLGIKRFALWICAASADTNITLPANWNTETTGATGQAIRLAIGSVSLDDAPFIPDPPYNAYIDNHIPAQTATLDTSTTSVCTMVQLNPTVAPLP